MAGYIYILTNKPLGTLYIGVTNDIQRRIYEHQQGLGSKFAKRYNLDKLVFMEEHPTLPLAIQREKSLKRYSRAWKVNLIEKDNRNWQDLSQTILI